MKLFRTADHTTTDDETARDENGDTAMSQEATQPVTDTRPVSAGLARAGEAGAGPATTYQDAASASGQPQPTFTPAPAMSADSTTVPSVRPDPTDDGGDFTRPVSAVAPVNHEAPAYDEPVAAFTADEPLIANSAGMRASWQKVQAEFVDDPQAAVMGAADLIEQTAQSLIDALQQRQRKLRVLSGRGAANGSTDAGGSAGFDSAADAGPDTEQLRLMMRRYRALFDQLCKA